MQSSTNDLDMRNRVAKAEVLRLQNTLKADGTLGPINPLMPELPQDSNWVCAHSTCRLKIKAHCHCASCRQQGSGTMVGDNLGRSSFSVPSFDDVNCCLLSIKSAAGTLQATLQSERRQDTEPGQFVRCFAEFVCTRCCRRFKKNTLSLEKVADKFLDPLTLAAP